MMIRHLDTPIPQCEAQRSKRRGRSALGLVALALLSAVSGCGGSSTSAPPDSTASESAASTPAATPTPPPKPEVRLSVREYRTVYSDNVTLTGRVSPQNAKVTMRGQNVAVQNGRWGLPVTLTKKGDTSYRFKATAKGHTRAGATTVVTRSLSAAERAEIKAQKEADFKASAVTIPYNQLNKDAEGHRGDHVLYRGQILQIQEDGNNGGIILLSVTDEGYGLWTDNVWIDYDHSISSAEGDMLTVYGTVQGSKSYDTQNGGSTYVPQVTAKYILE